jgi:hypothetical protein
MRRITKVLVHNTHRQDELLKIVVGLTRPWKKHSWFEQKELSFSFFARPKSVRHAGTNEAPSSSTALLPVG